jgi:hypothetical protein
VLSEKFHEEIQTCIKILKDPQYEPLFEGFLGMELAGNLDTFGIRRARTYGLMRYLLNNPPYEPISSLLQTQLLHYKSVTDQ